MVCNEFVNGRATPSRILMGSYVVELEIPIN